MITGINELKTLTKHVSCKLNENLMEQNVIQINGGIMINVSVSVKKFMYVKKIMFGILTDIIVETENVSQVLWMIQLLFEMK